MKFRHIAIIGILSVLISACANQQPAPSANRIDRKPATDNRIGRSAYTLPLPGQRTVGDVVQAYGQYTKGKLEHYFHKANVAYPPREMVLIALKQEKRLELWARNNGEFRLIRDYFILAASGEPGPKLHQGDKQVPEGVYRITSMNPNSHYHLSMKLNYPNEFDVFHAEQEGRTHLGSDIFIHGKDVSIGCLAVGDAAIRELFVLTAQVGLENVKVIIAPHDPRNYPLLPDSATHPVWTSELYAMISREIENVAHGVKLPQSGYN